MRADSINVEIVVTDSAGDRFVGTAELVPRGSRSARNVARPRPTHSESNRPKDMDFTLQPRAFVKKYAKGMSGAQKFVLLTAKLSAGSTAKPVDLASIAKQWGKMTSLMGGEFNNAHAVRAGDNGWVNKTKRGIYVLRSSWTEIFGLEK